MVSDQFLNLLATIFGGAGSIYVLKAILQLTPNLTERLAATRWGHNTDLIDSLATQRAESIVGTMLILVAVLLAVVNAATAPSNILITRNKLLAIFLAIVLSTLVYALLLLVGRAANFRHRLAVARIIAADTLDRLFKNRTIQAYEIKSLRHLNDKYLHLRLSPGATSRDFLRLVAQDVGRTLPEDIQVEDDT